MSFQYHYNYDSYHTNDPTLVMLLMGAYFLIMILSMAAAALIFVSRWHIFKKMGMPGWKGIIPYYGDYLMFKTVWNTKAFWAQVIGSGVYLVVYLMTALMLPIIIAFTAGASHSSQPPMFLMISFGAVEVLLLLAFLVFIFVIQIKLCLRLAKAFGKGTGYALGLAFLSAIFLPMLAFGKARYQGVVQQPTTFR